MMGYYYGSVAGNSSVCGVPSPLGPVFLVLTLVLVVLGIVALWKYIAKK